eukprot:354256-Chlamydomonas_euryale.AAC.7
MHAFAACVQRGLFFASGDRHPVADLTCQAHLYTGVGLRVPLVVDSASWGRCGFACLVGRG